MDGSLRNCNISAMVNCPQKNSAPKSLSNCQQGNLFKDIDKKPVRKEGIEHIEIVFTYILR